jgi:sulfur relay (sulfurtransferase) DsrC/TusE family protein
VSIATDKEGLLLDPGQWTPALARRLAAELGLELTPERWEIVCLAACRTWDESTAPPGKAAHIGPMSRYIVPLCASTSGQSVLAFPRGSRRSPKSGRLLVRDGFHLNQTVPEPQRVLQALRQRHGQRKATRGYLHAQFPHGFVQQACKIAGVRKPLNPMSDA